MNHLTRNDYAQALVVLAHLESACAEPGVLVLAAVQALAELVPCDGVALACSVDAEPSDMKSGPGARAGKTIGVVVGPASAARTLSVPLFAEGCTLVSIVLRRRAMDFDARERERLELLRPHLSFLYREACRGGRLPPGRRGHATSARPTAPGILPATLTERECEVVHWLAAGKTDAEIGALLSISARTVQKHLEHVYIKLGVETRTAAVMRALGNGLRQAPALAPNL